MVRQYAQGDQEIVNEHDRRLFGTVGVRLYYTLIQCKDLLTDDLPQSVPALALTIGEWLDCLGSTFVRPDPGQCLSVLEHMVARPGVHRFLMSAFDPNVVGLNAKAKASIYKTIQEIPDAESNFAFSVLSKVIIY